MLIDDQAYGRTPAAVSIFARPHPFSAERVDAVVPAGGPLIELLQDAKLDAALFAHHATFVFVNDRLIPREEWSLVRPAAGDVVSVRVAPGGQGGGKMALRVVAMIAVAIASYYVGPAAGAAAGSELFGAAVTAVVGVAGMMAVNALIPPPSPDLAGGGKGNSAYGVTGTRNAADPYGPVPRIFGRHKVYPRYAAMPYTELQGSDQYLRCLFLIGKGRYDLSAHKIGETALETFAEVQRENYYSGESGEPYTLFPSDVYEEALSIELTQSGGWQTRSTQTGTDEISFDLSFPGGLYRVGSTGNIHGTEVVVEVEYAPYGTTNWVKYIGAYDLRFSGTPSISIAAGQAVVGVTSGATGTVRFAHQKSENLQTGTDDNGDAIYTGTRWTDWVRVEVASGTFQAGETVTIAGTYSAVISSLTANSATLQGRHKGLYRYGYTLKVPRGQYTLRWKRTTADHADDEYMDNVYVTALRSIAYEAPVTLAGCTLVALRIKGTGQLNGVIDQYNCIAEAIVSAHDGSGWNAIKTRNPAWAFCEVLTGNSNKRPVTTSRLDLTRISAWAANCTTAGRTFDAVIDRPGTVWDVLKTIAAVGRATPGMIDNKFTAVEDTSQSTPVQHFSPRNSWGFRGQKAFPTLPHAFKCRFMNADEDWAQDERIVYDDGYTSANATRFETLDFMGVTSADQAWKLGRYFIAVARLRPEVFELNVDAEHLVCTRGDLVRLTHDVLSIGSGQGRIKALTTSGGNITAITFDDIFTMEAGKSYAFRARKSDGSSSVNGVVTAAGEQLTVTLSPAIAVSGGPAVGDLCLFGEVNEESIPCLVSRIQPGPDMSARLSLVEYNAAIYTADGGTIPTHDSHITIDPPANRTPPAPNIVSTHYGVKDSQLKDDGTYDIRLTVIYESQAAAFAQGATANQDNPDVIRGFQAEYRLSDDTDGDGEWIRLPQLAADARQFDFSVQNGEEYDVRVRSFSLPGLYSDWDTESAIAISLAGTTPADVTGLQVKGGGTSFTQADCEIEWTAVTGGGTAGLLVRDYKVEVRTSDGLTILRTEYVTGPAYSYTRAMNVADGGPRAALQFRVWARSKWGDLSTNYASLAATNPVPTAPASLGSRSWMGGVEFYWAANTEADFSHFTYRLKVGTAGSWGSWQRTGKTGVERLLGPAEKDTHGVDATIYIEVKAVDLLGQESTASADDEVCGSLNIQPTDIDDFAVSASKLFTKIPICQGLALTNNSPSAGYVAWDAFKIYYNGVEYSIAAGNSDKKYLYWKDLASTLTGADTHPADALEDWVPHEDFIIAINISGSGQQAWNAIANQVIGSAYIMTAAVGDLQVSDLSGTKIRATTSIAIGSATWGNDGIQLEYNAGNPRFYAGDGANQFVKFDGANLSIRGAVEIIGGVPSNMLANPGFEDSSLYWTAPLSPHGFLSSGGYESNYCLELGRAAGVDNACYAADVSRATRYFEVSPGHVYDVGCNYKSVEGTARARLSVWFYDKDLGSVDGSTVGSGYSTSWSTISGKVTIPSGVRFMTYYLNADTANGYVRFDNCWMRKTDELAYSWTASGDRTKIDGGNIYASSSVSIGNTTYGADGIQLQYNGGNPRFYAGDGSNNYIEFNGSYLKVSTDTTDGLVVKGGGNLLIDSGGDLILNSVRTANSRIYFKGPSGLYGAIITLDYLADLGSSVPYVSWNPENNSDGVLNIGDIGASKAWEEIYIETDELVRLRAYYDGDNSSAFKVFCASGQGRADLNLEEGGTLGGLEFRVGGIYLIADHKTMDIAESAKACDDVYADDFQNVADFFFLDDRDDLAALKQIKGCGQIDPRTGLEMIDDDTLPTWMLSRTKDGAEPLLDPTGRPYLSLKMLTSLLMGACRQLDARLAAVEAQKSKGGN